MHDLDATVRRTLDELYPSLDAVPQRWEELVAEARLDQHRGRPTRRVVALAAAAVALISLAAIVPTTLLPDKRLGVSEAAAVVLKRTATLAAAQSPTTPGRYRYQKVRVLEAGIALVVPEPHTALFPRTRETWVASDGSGRTREITGDPIFPSPRDRERWLAANGSWEPERVSDERFGPRNDLTDAASLPRETDRLEQTLFAEAKTKDPPLSAAMLGTISDLLASPAASPELRAALYRVLAKVDGVELAGSMTDSLGRHGLAISAPGGYSNAAVDRRDLVIFDPETGTVLERRTVLVQPVEWTGATPPTTIGEMTYVESGWVDSIDERPTSS